MSIYDDPSSMAQLEHIEALAPGHGGVPVYNFDWRDPHDPTKFRKEWFRVLDELKSRRASAQNAHVAEMYETALGALTNEFYVRPDTMANVMSRAMDCMEAKMRPGNEQFQAWVATCIRECAHAVFRREKVWLDPKYQKPLENDEWWAKVDEGRRKYE